MIELNSNISIFGASGFVGKHIADSLEEVEDFNLQRFSSSDADLSDIEKVKLLYEEIRFPSTFIIASAITPDRCNDANDETCANLKMAENLVPLISSEKVHKIIYLSTVDVYGRENLTLPLDASSPIKPTSNYAAYKFEAEQVLHKVCERENIPLVVLRLPGVYGPGDTHNSPIRAFLSAAIKGDRITVHGNGEQRRDFLYVGDIPPIISELCSTELDGIYNVVSGHSVTINEILSIIEKIVGSKLDIEYAQSDSQIDLIFRESGLKNCLPPLNFTHIEKGLRLTYDHLKEK